MYKAFFFKSRISCSGIKISIRIVICDKGNWYLIDWLRESKESWSTWHLFNQKLKGELWTILSEPVVPLAIFCPLAYAYEAPFRATRHAVHVGAPTGALGRSRAAWTLSGIKWLVRRAQWVMTMTFAPPPSSPWLHSWYQHYLSTWMQN